jgi:rhamnulokinase
MRWRWRELVENVRIGLDRARALGPLASIGIDGWAVDYGLVDEHGLLLSDPHSYRSPRTEGWRSVAHSLGERELYRRTGIQLMPINTIFQPAAHDREELARAERLVMLPELVAHELTGAAVGERTNAGTTGLLDVATGDWSSDFTVAIGRSSILPPLEPVGRASATTGRPFTSSPRTTPHARSPRARSTARVAPSSRPGPGSSWASSARLPTPPSRPASRTSRTR